MEKIRNSIGLFCYGSKDVKGHLVDVSGLCLMVNINEQPLLIVNRFLLNQIPELFIPKFIFKVHNNNSVSVINTFRIEKHQFSTHSSDSENATYNIAVAPPNVDSQNLDLIDLPLNYQPPILLNNHKVQVATILKSDFRTEDISNDEPTNISFLEGNIYNLKENIPINQNYDFIKQSIINLDLNGKDKDDLFNQVFTGSFVFTTIEGSIIPIGIGNAMIQGENLRFLNHYSDSELYLAYTDFFQVMKVLHQNLENDFPRKYNSPTEYYLDNISELRDEVERIIDEILSKRIEDLKEGDYDDKIVRHINQRMRSLRGELLSLRFNFVMIEQNLLDKEWWDFTHMDNAPSENQKHGLISHFDSTIVRSFVIGFFSVMEHMLRSTLRTIDEKAVKNARGSFSKVTNYYLERLAIDNSEKENYENLLAIFSHIRNSIHNDGQIFWEYKQGETVRLDYRGGRVCI